MKTIYEMFPILEEMDAKVFFYYHNEPVIGNVYTACLIVKDGEVLARGLAVKSLLDVHDKHLARIKSLGRAVKALVGQDDSLPMNHDRASWDNSGIECKYSGEREHLIRWVNHMCLELVAFKERPPHTKMMKNIKVFIPATMPIEITKDEHGLYKSAYRPEITERETEIIK